MGKRGLAWVGCLLRTRSLQLKLELFDGASCLSRETKIHLG